MDKLPDRKSAAYPVKGRIPDPADFPIVAPAYMLWPPRWRTRVDEILTLFAARSGLLSLFAEARAAGEAGRDLEAQQTVRAIVDANRDLFPAGSAEDAGFELAWAIVCGKPPRSHRPGPGYAPLKLFTNNVPPLRAGRRNRSTRHVKLLDLLSGRSSHPPKTIKEAAEELGFRTTTPVHKMLGTLRARGVRIPHAAEQDRRVGEITELRDGLRANAGLTPDAEDTPGVRAVVKFFSDAH